MSKNKLLKIIVRIFEKTLRFFYDDITFLLLHSNTTLKNDDKSLCMTLVPYSSFLPLYATFWKGKKITNFRTKKRKTNYFLVLRKIREIYEI